MIEVEAKIKISSPEEARKKIRQIAKFTKKQVKIDDYYTLEKLNHYPEKSLRIRKTGNTYEINFKQRLSYIKGIHAKNEQEFKSDDIEDFLILIKNFGFRKWLTKIKHNETYRIRKNFNIELNHVKNLGWFAEVEYLTTLGDINKARKEVLKVISLLGAGRKDIIKDGYTKLLWDKR